MPIRPSCRPTLVAMLMLGLVVQGGGCAPKQPSVQPPRGALRGVDPIVLALPNARGGLSLVGVSGMGTAGNRPGSDVELVRRAAEVGRFELQKIGFTVITDSTAAKAVAELTMGSVRFDPAAGWVASDAILRFRRVGSNEEIARFQARNEYVTPDVAPLITSLAKAVEKAR